MNEKTPLFKKSSSTDSINAEGGTLPRFITDPRIKGKQHFKYAVPSQETEEAQRDRFLSIRICYLNMFLSSVSFTISISSMWPFLLLIDKTTDTSFFGWIVSGYSVGQLIASPLFGYWATRSRYHKLPIIVCMLIMAFGNLIYLYLESLGQIQGLKMISPKVWMLVSRFIMGFGAACAAVTRSYCSSATNVDERTSILSNISACQGIGFIIGPVLQAAFVPIGYPGPVNIDAFHFNMYTSPALMSIIIYLGLALLMVRYFNEYVVLDNAIQNDTAKIVEINTGTNDDQYAQTLRDLPPPDYTAVSLTLFLFFTNCFVFSFFETLSSPFTIDMYAWSKSQATLYNGIIIGVIGILSVVFVLVSKVLAKRIKEKKLMLAGYIVLFISIIALLPWGDDYPPVAIPTILPGHRNTTTNTLPTTTITGLFSTTESTPRGCPFDYKWCLNTPIVRFWQFLLGCTLLVTGYSVSNVMSFAIYSKILGPKPQGLWMGILTSFGSLSRAVGPVVVAYLYDLYGPRVSFIFLASVVLLATLIIILTYKKYEPYKF